MAKTKRKHQKHSPSQKDSKSCNVSSVSFTREELQHIIAKAIIEAKKIEQDTLVENDNKPQGENGQLSNSNAETAKHGFFCSLSKTLKDIWIVLTLPFIGKRKITGDGATVVLLKMFIKLFIQIAKFIFIVACVILFSAAISALVAKTSFSWISIALCFIFGFNFYLFAGMFQVASIEADHINDKSFLFGLFGAISSFVSTTIAIISLVIGG